MNYKDMSLNASCTLKRVWTFCDAQQIFNLPFFDLLYKAQTAHRQHFDPNTLQTSTLLSIKTGGCGENCAYCTQSSKHKTNTAKTPMMDKESVIEAAKRAKDSGSTRFCMGASGRSPSDGELIDICEMVKAIKELGLETCVTLGMLKEHQAAKLKDAGLDFYNHNIDTSPEFYAQVITSRTFEDRLNTLEILRKAGIKVCCGGILGMGETNDDRIKMLVVLANLETPPESIPINKLINFPGTPLENATPPDSFDVVRIIALARIMMPISYIRLSAGRENMPDELQALCFLSGANSIFYGDKLLTADNPATHKDDALLERLNLAKA